MPTVWTGTLKKMSVEATVPVTYRFADGGLKWTTGPTTGW